MEDLLEAYLKHVGHYLMNEKIKSFKHIIINDEQHYKISIGNNWLETGYETISISVSDLLVFLFERGDQ